jgi:uncharacterized protein (TIGR00375 family)
MKFIADFHIHSPYSRATSKQLTPEWLDYWAKIKGIDLLGTGDCIHPAWLDELEDKLVPAANGLYTLKPSSCITQELPPVLAHKKVHFALTTELSSIYKKNGAVRKVHTVCVFPDFKAARQMQSKLARVGNITADGRPILGLDATHILEMVLEIGRGSFLFPAHIWTPWFSVLGSRSGFDTPDECFEELTEHIFCVETGLSSDPPMNRRCSFLDKFRLISNSDAHSPEKLGREANMFDADFSFDGIVRALKDDDGFLGTIEFFPEEGKYHLDGHRKCDICWDPDQTKAHNGRCSVCGQPVTKGVLSRVIERADRANPDAFYGKQTFLSITPLPSLVSEVLNKKNTTSKAVRNEYRRIISSLGAEFDILLFRALDEIKEQAGERISEGIRRLRAGRVHIEAGYDGEFGTIKVFDQQEREKQRDLL